MSEIFSAASGADRPLVTHFVYGYRQERIIRAAIESVLAQTYQPLEIVLSDDCSPDGTYGIMQEMAAAYDGPHRIILNRNPTNLGHARHVERIMEISSGDFIVESAGDDISLPERTERLVGAWLASGRRAHVVHSEKQDIDAAGAMMDFVLRTDILADITPRQKLQRRHDLIGASMGWSREVYERFGPISDVAAFQDYPIAFRALLLGGVHFIPEPLVLCRIGGASQKKTEFLWVLVFLRRPRPLHALGLRIPPQLPPRPRPAAAARLRGLRRALRRLHPRGRVHHRAGRHDPPAALSRPAAGGGAQPAPPRRVLPAHDRQVLARPAVHALSRLEDAPHPGPGAARRRAGGHVLIRAARGRALEGRREGRAGDGALEGPADGPLSVEGLAVPGSTGM